MGRGAVVLRRVLIRRVVAASDMTAFETQAEMNPLIAGGETLFAAVRSVRAVVPRLTEVSAQLLGHHISLRYVVGCW
jgi:hypothetical protein